MDKMSILLWGAYNIMTLGNGAKTPSNSLECATHTKPLCCALYNQNFNQVHKTITCHKKLYTQVSKKDLVVQINNCLHRSLTNKVFKIVCRYEILIDWN